MALPATAFAGDRQLGLSEVVEKYPDVPRLVALKIDVQRRGVHYTEETLRHVDETIFDWICPGKAERVGYREWKRRLVAAVDIFGRGNVGTGLVGGVELARPNGFTSEDDALKSTLDEAEDLASHGVTTVYIVWVPRPGSVFRDQKNPSLEYYVRLARGLHDLRVRYGLRADFDDYRRCGNHPDSDLSRLL